MDAQQVLGALAEAKRRMADAPRQMRAIAAKWRVDLAKEKSETPPAPSRTPRPHPHRVAAAAGIVVSGPTGGEALAHPVFAATVRTHSGGGVGGATHTRNGAALHQALVDALSPASVAAPGRHMPPTSAAAVLRSDPRLWLSAAAQLYAGGRPPAHPMLVANTLRGVAAAAPSPTNLLWKVGATPAEVAWVEAATERRNPQEGAGRPLTGRWTGDAAAAGRSPYPWNQTLLAPTHTDQHGRAYAVAGGHESAGAAPGASREPRASSPFIVWSEPATARERAAEDAVVPYPGGRARSGASWATPMRGAGGIVGVLEAPGWWGCLAPRPPHVGDSLVLTANGLLWEYPHVLAHMDPLMPPASGAWADDASRTSGERFRSRKVRLIVVGASRAGV